MSTLNISKQTNTPFVVFAYSIQFKLLVAVKSNT